MPLGAVGWAMVGSAAIGAIGSNMAAGTQASGQQAAAGVQQHMFDTINSQEQPFMQAGYGATSRLSDLMGTSGNTGASGYGSLTSNFTPQDFLANKDPGYQFQLDTGAQALRNADTPGVGALSGPALKDLMSFNQGMASTGYQNAFNRFTTQQNNIFSRLSGIAGMGQNAASNTGTAGTQLGTGMGQAIAGAGASRAGGIVGATNAIGGAGVPLGYFMNNGGSGYSQSLTDSMASQNINDINNQFAVAPIAGGS
jgi:hypothetical protein